jgi:hypothetical protein
MPFLAGISPTVDAATALSTCDEHGISVRTRIRTGAASALRAVESGGAVLKVVGSAREERRTCVRPVDNGATEEMRRQEAARRAWEALPIADRLMKAMTQEPCATGSCG